MRLLSSSLGFLVDLVDRYLFFQRFISDSVCDVPMEIVLSWEDVRKNE